MTPLGALPLVSLRGGGGQTRAPCPYLARGFVRYIPHPTRTGQRRRREKLVVLVALAVGAPGVVEEEGEELVSLLARAPILAQS